MSAFGSKADMAAANAGEIFEGARADIGGDPQQPWVHIAWKYLLTAKDSWLPRKTLGFETSADRLQAVLH
jgi:hypothetical protein